MTVWLCSFSSVVASALLVLALQTLTNTSVSWITNMMNTGHVNIVSFNNVNAMVWPCNTVDRASVTLALFNVTTIVVSCVVRWIIDIVVSVNIRMCVNSIINLLAVRLIMLSSVLHY